MGIIVLFMLFFAGFMIATQFFFTLCLLGVLISTILVLMFFLCCGPDQRRFVTLIKSIGYIMLTAGECCSEMLHYIPIRFCNRGNNKIRGA